MPERMAVEKNTGLKRILKAAQYSIQGIKAAWTSEAAFRQEVLLSIVLIPAGFWLGENGVERVILTGSVMLILIVELLNSAIESVVDRFGGEFHELSGRAKDMGSAAVMLSLILAVLAWVCVLW